MYYNLKRFGVKTVSVMACEGRYYCDHAVGSEGYTDLGCWQRISYKDYVGLEDLSKGFHSFQTQEVKGKYRHMKVVEL
jgi:hypothetical protein